MRGQRQEADEWGGAGEQRAPCGLPWGLRRAAGPTTHFARHSPEPSGLRPPRWLRGTGPHLLQVVELHRNLPEEEVDVAAPLHRVHKVGLCRTGQSGPAPGHRGSLGLGTNLRVIFYGEGVSGVAIRQNEPGSNIFGREEVTSLTSPRPPLQMATAAILCPLPPSCVGVRAPAIPSCASITGAQATHCLHALLRSKPFL